MKKSVMIGFAALGGSLAWGDIAVDRQHVEDVTTAADAVQGTDVYFADTAVKVEKSGAGTWTLSTSNVQTRATTVIGVREGTLRLETGTDPAARTAPACLERAALWLDASKSSTLVAGTSASSVSRWMDARETTDGTAYYCAEAKANAGTSTTTYPVTKTYAEKPDLTYVNFNGKASGSWMRLLLPGTRSDAASLSQIRHVFFSGYVESAWGYPLAANEGNDTFWHPASSSGSLSYYLSAISSSRKMLSGESSLNGCVFDPVSTVVGTGAYLYEWDSANDYGWFGNFFNDRNLWSAANGYRCGGDSLGEVVVFTNRLTTLEREAVGEYLMRKWVKEHTSGGFDVRLAKSATVETAGLKGVSVSGAGTVALTEEGADVLCDKDRAFDGEIRPVAAQVKVETSEPALKIAKGDRLAVAADSYLALDLSRTTESDLTEQGTVAASVGTNAAIRLAALPTDVRTLSVTGSGEVVLSAPRESTVLDAAANGVYATMENANMEEWQRPAGSSGEAHTSSSSVGAFYHWTIEENLSGSLCFLDIGAAKILGDYIIDGAVKSNYSYVNYPFEGNGIMVLKSGKTVSNAVTFPADGDYELTFLSAGRMNGPTSALPNEYAGGILKMSLVDSDSQTIKIGTALGYVGTVQQFQRFRIAGVRAGTYRFVLKHDVGTQDMCMIVDDFKFRLITDGARETIVRPPNDGFECATFVWEKSPETRRETKNYPDDWTLGQTTSASEKPDVCLVTRGFVNTSFRQGADYGGVQLAFYGDGGLATSAAFTLPAGTWRLRLKKASLENESVWIKWNGKTVQGASAVAAALVVDSEERLFGTTPATIVARLTPETLPTAVTLTEAKSVQLRLWGTSAATASTVPCAIVDEIELVRETPADEILANGAFADATGWTLVSDKTYYSNCGAMVADPCRLAAGVDFAYPYGATYGVNAKALQINHYGSAEQSVTFPEAGAYRLEYSSRARVWVTKDGSAADDLSYAGNRARFYLIDSSGVTNEIAVSAPLETTNFVFRSAVFRVPAAGAYTFGVMGVNGMPLPDGTRAASYRRWPTEATFFIDQISVRRIAAATPEIAEGAALDFGKGTHLRLDFIGQKKVDSLRFNGRRISGVLDATHSSGLVSGPGQLYADPAGFKLMVR